MSEALIESKLREEGYEPITSCKYGLETSKEKKKNGLRAFNSSD